MECCLELMKSNTAAPIDILVTIDRLKITKFGGISKLKLVGSLSINDSYWLEHNWIVLPTNKNVVAHLAAR